METTDQKQTKDSWDRADIIGKLIISVAALLITVCLNTSAARRQSNEKMLDVAVRILERPDTSTSDSLRTWALTLFRNAAKVSWAELPAKADSALSNGAQLPAPAAWTLPNPGQLRVRILSKFGGTQTGLAAQIRDSLVALGYSDTEAREVRGEFPNSTEVRYYYPEDGANARSLNEHLKHLLNLKTRSNSEPHPASNHVPGELHVYLQQ